MPFGYTGKILHVDLTDRKIEIEKPDEGLIVVSMQHMPDGIRYRVVGEHVRRYPGAVEENPSLEDGYVWLMKSRA